MDQKDANVRAVSSQATPRSAKGLTFRQAGYTLRANKRPVSPSEVLIMRFSLAKNWPGSLVK
jgi:hypothetical protein